MKLLNRLVSKTIEERKISELNLHPENEKIYGVNEDVSDLVEKIKDSNEVSTLTITPDNKIISGHRRYKACKVLGIEKVTVMVKSYETYEEEIQALIVDNAQRVKTELQRAREIKAYNDAEKILADRRMKAGKNPSPISDEGQQEKGRSRDITAKKLNVKSGTEVDRLSGVVEIIDDLQKENTKEAKEAIEIIEGQLKAPSTAHELAKVIRDGKLDVNSLDEKTKQEFKSGKSANRIVEDIKKREKQKNDESVTNNRDGIEKAIITKEDVSNAVNEFNAMSRGEIPMEVVVYSSNVIINGIKEMVAEFGCKMTKIMAYENEIKRLSKDEFQTISKLLIRFEETYFKDKNNLLKGVK